MHAGSAVAVVTQWHEAFALQRELSAFMSAARPAANKSRPGTAEGHLGHAIRHADAIAVALMELREKVAKRS